MFLGGTEEDHAINLSLSACILPKNVLHKQEWNPSFNLFIHPLILYSDLRQVHSLLQSDFTHRVQSIAFSISSILSFHKCHPVAD
jgi:hypothetical protein